MSADLVLAFHREFRSHSSPSQCLDMAVALEKVSRKGTCAKIMKYLNSAVRLIGAFCLVLKSRPGDVVCDHIWPLTHYMCPSTGGL